MKVGRTILWAAGTLLALILILAIALVVISRTQRFHQVVVRAIQQKVEQATGARVEIGRYTLRLFELRADLYDITAHGTEPATAEPLLRLEHLGVGIDIISLLRPRFRLASLTLDRPVVNLIVTDGGTNIPKLKTQPQSRIPRQSEPSEEGVIDLKARRVDLNNGEITVSHRTIKFDAHIRDLQARARFDASSSTYSGSLQYNEGTIKYGDAPPILTTLQVEATAGATRAEIAKAILRTGGSSLSLQGTIEDFSAPKFVGTYALQFATQDASALIKRSLPPAVVNATGNARYTSSAAPFVSNLYLDGQLSSPAIMVVSDAATAVVTGINGRFRLADGNLTVNSLRARLLNGEVAAEGSVSGLGATQRGRARLTYTGLSLRALSNALAQMPLQRTPLQGTMRGSADATWVGSLSSIVVRSTTYVQASTDVPTSGQAASALPIDATLNVRYRGRGKILSLDQSHIHTPRTSLGFNGTASKNSSIVVQLATSDLHELAVLAASFQTDSSSNPDLSSLRGSARFNGEIRGSLDNPRVSGQLAANDIEIRQAAARVIRAGLSVNSSQLSVSNGYIQSVPHGLLQFSLSAALDNWSYGNSNTFELEALATDFDLAQLQRFANVAYPASGILSAEISVSGSPAQPLGNGQVQLRDAVLWGQSVTSVQGKFSGTRDGIQTNVALRSQAGNLNADLFFNPKTQAYRLQAVGSDISLEKVDAVQKRGMALRGTLNITAEGEGTVQDPQLTASARIPRLVFQRYEASDIAATVNLANRIARVSVGAQLLSTSLRAEAAVQLNQNYDLEAQIDAPQIPLDPVIAAFSTADLSRFNGRAGLHATLRGPLANPAAMQGHLTIPTLAADYQAFSLHNTAPIEAEFSQGIVTLQLASFQGTGTDLRVSATWPVKSPGALKASVQGTVNLAMLELVQRDAEASGRLEAHVTAEGSMKDPNLSGTIQVVDANYHAPGTPLGVEHLSGELALRNDRIDIVQLEGQSGGGAISASGSLTYRTPVQFDVALNADSVRLRYPDGVRTILGAQLALSGSSEDASLSGRVLINRLSFTNDFDLGGFLEQFRGTASAPSGGGVAQNIKLNVSVQSAAALALQSAKLSVQGTSNLLLKGTAANPIITGRATLTSGEIFFLGNRYQIENGVIEFANPTHTEPVVNFTVRTQVDNYNISMTFVGPVDRMRTTYTSDPPLPPVDIINLLAFGKPVQGGNAAARPTTMGAESVIAQGLASQVSGQVERLVGISHLSIDPGIGTGQSNPGARLAIQQRVSKNLLFTFAVDVTSAQGTAVQVQYGVGEGWSISAGRDQNGAYSVEVQRRRTF